MLTAGAQLRAHQCQMELAYERCILIDLPGRTKRSKGRPLNQNQLLDSQNELDDRQHEQKRQLVKIVCYEHVKYLFAFSKFFLLFVAHTILSVILYFERNDVTRSVFPFSEIRTNHFYFQVTLS